MTEEKTEKRKLEIRLSQVIGTALAAITAAFLGSRLGTAGTIIGAGLASVVTTLAGALYQHSLDRTGRSLRSKVEAFTNSDEAAGGQTTVVIPPGDDRPTVVLRPMTAPPTRARWRPNWKIITATSVLAFVLGMGVITGIELLNHGPISGGNSGTTFGSMFGQPTERAPQHQEPVDQPTEPTGHPATSTTTPAPTSAPPTSTSTPPTSGPTTTTPPTSTPPPSSTTPETSAPAPASADGVALPTPSGA